MWYAVEYAYGSNVVNNGNRADRVYEFTNRKLRDAWVAAGAPQIGPGERGTLSARHPLVRGNNWMIEGDSEAWQVLAERRVDASPALSRYRDVLIYADWREADHYRWVATEDMRALIHWARDTQQAAHA